MPFISQKQLDLLKKKKKKPVKKKKNTIKTKGKSFNVNRYVDKLLEKYNKKKIRKHLNKGRALRQNEDYSRRERLKQQVVHHNKMLMDAQRQHGFIPVSLINPQMMKNIDSMPNHKLNKTWNNMYIPIAFDPINNFSNLHNIYGNMLSLGGSGTKADPVLIE